jgi:hypothetical protein
MHGPHAGIGETMKYILLAFALFVTPVLADNPKVAFCNRVASGVYTIAKWRDQGHTLNQTILVIYMLHEKNEIPDRLYPLFNLEAAVIYGSNKSAEYWQAETLKTCYKVNGITSA